MSNDYDNPDPTAPGHDPSEIDLIGKVIHNRYRIKDRLGEGGFGAVYRAEHVQMGRVCALKVLHPRMARDDQVVARFKREAQAASVLKDSHTVQIYDFDQDEAGGFYLAMELVDGRSLHSEISRGPIPMLRVAHILDGVAQSLGEAHQHGIVHRDIKPENILLAERQNDRDYVKVLDFGIAKIARGSNLQGGPALTAAGQTLGTVEYMSPEQLMGQELDGRSDLYALGVLTYEMLTGSLPFNTRTPAEMISAHLKTVPTPPSQHSPGLGISPEMDRVVLKLLEKKRDQRYASTADLQNDLRVILGLPPLGVAASAARTSPVTATMAQISPAPPAARKNTTLLIAVVAAALLGVLALGYLLFGGKAHAAPATPVARLLPAGLPGLLVIDVPQLRATAPPAVVQMVLDAARPQLKEIGADPDKLGQVAAGFVPPHGGSAGAGGILVVDLPVDAQLLEKQLQGPMRSVPYKDVTIRRGKVDSYAVLPGDRLVMGLRHDLTRAIELSSGQGGQASSLVDGPAAKLLGRVGASGGRGPALFGWLHVSEQQRTDLSRALPALSKFEEMAGSLAVGSANGAETGSGGVDARMVGRCASDTDAQAAAVALRTALEEAGRNPMVALLGLRSLLDNLRITEAGPMVNATLHLSAAQYADLVTRLGGVASTMAQEVSLTSPGGQAPSGKAKAKTKSGSGNKASAPQ